MGDNLPVRRNPLLGTRPPCRELAHWNIGIPILRDIVCMVSVRNFQIRLILEREENFPHHQNEEEKRQHNENDAASRTSPPDRWRIFVRRHTDEL